MKKFLLLLTLSAAAMFTTPGCSKDDDGQYTESGSSSYTFVKSVNGYDPRMDGRGMPLSVYSKGGTRYIKWGPNYYTIRKNGKYQRSYTGKDVTKKYPYCSTINTGSMTVSYYFNL